MNAEYSGQQHRAAPTRWTRKNPRLCEQAPEPSSTAAKPAPNHARVHPRTSQHTHLQLGAAAPNHPCPSPGHAPFDSLRPAILSAPTPTPYYQYSPTPSLNLPMKAE